MTFVTKLWTRRDWVTAHTAALTAGLFKGTLPPTWSVPRSKAWSAATIGPLLARHAERLDPSVMQSLARRAVEAAQAAGAQYADARLTRTVRHCYFVSGDIVERRNPLSQNGEQEGYNGNFSCLSEMLGIGVRALVHGYWGFAASPIWEPDEAARLAQDAVGQAKDNADGPPRPVDWAPAPAVTGTWVMPVTLDPFTISVEEKEDTIVSWAHRARQYGLYIDPPPSWLLFTRQEQVLATSEGSLVTQTTYESGGELVVTGGGSRTLVQGIASAGKGWELFLDAKIPEQLAGMRDILLARAKAGAKPVTVGRYTLVCDGATMASLVDSTLGTATQLDRALGYEANANGTSFLTDPMAMVGELHVAAPLVTVTANRSAPGQLATIKWDNEGVAPQDVTLVKDGVLHDFQTTREQAAWLAPYYQKVGNPVRSHGYAAAEDALCTTLQHMPNLALEPARSAASLDDLVANVQDGILVLNAEVTELDSQARNGLLGGKEGTMRQIKNGRLGPYLSTGAVLFNTQDLWKHITALGGTATRATIPVGAGWLGTLMGMRTPLVSKGQPAQQVSRSATGVAAMIPNQAIIYPGRRA